MAARPVPGKDANALPPNFPGKATAGNEPGLVYTGFFYYPLYHGKDYHQ